MVLMADLSRPPPRRHRSSTSKSHAAPLDDSARILGECLEYLSSRDLSAKDIDTGLDRLVGTLDHGIDLEMLQDHFRRQHGFQLLMNLATRRLQCSELDIQSVAHQLLRILDALYLAFHNHDGNRRYFARRVGNGGWSVLMKTLCDFHKIIFDQASKSADSLLGPLTVSLLAIAIGDNGMKPDFNLRENGDHSAGDDSLVKLDTAFAKVPHSTVIKAPLALPIALTICYRAAEQTSSFLLSCIKAFENLANANPANIDLISGSGVVRHVIQLLQDEQLAEGVEEVLRRLLPQLLRAGFGDLKTAEFIYKSAASNHKVRRMLELATSGPKESPCVRFDLSLAGHSSLEFACLPRAFPPPTGYSLTAWIRIEEFDPNHHTTLFGAFDATQTCFILAYVERGTGQLILQTSISSPNPSVRFKRFRFEKDAWCHVCVVHKPPKVGLLGEALLYINGRFVERRDACLYPEPAPLRSSAANSAPFPPESNTRMPVQAFFGTPQDLAELPDEDRPRSRWALATAHLYDLCLSRDLIAIQHSLGPMYSGSFQDRVGQLLTYDASAALNRYNEELYGDKAEQSNIVATIQNRGVDALHEGTHLLSIFSASTVDIDGMYSQAISVLNSLPDGAARHLHNATRTGNIIVFNANRPLLADALTRPSGTGLLTGQASVSIPKTMDDAAWRLSGFVGTHLMLLEAANTPTELRSALKTLCQSIRDNFRASEAMEREQGYGMVALVIRDKLAIAGSNPSNAASVTSILFQKPEDRNQLMLDLLNSILGFVGVDIDQPAQSLLTNPMAYRSFLTDLDTWRSGSMAGQRMYYKQFCWMLQGNGNVEFNSKRLSKMRIVRKVIDCLRSDPIHVENLEYVLQALRVLLTYTASKTDHRDLATFIGYCLQEGRTGLSTTRPTRRMTIRLEFPDGRTPSPAGSARSGRQADDYMSKGAVSKSDLGAKVLGVYSSLVCDPASTTLLRRFHKNVPISWLLHLLAEGDGTNVEAAFRIICRSVTVMGPEFLTRLSAKNAGIMVVKARIRLHWNHPAIWWSCLSALFGIDTATMQPSPTLSGDKLKEAFPPESILIRYPDVMTWLIGLIDAAIEHIDQAPGLGDENASDSVPNMVSTIVSYLMELHEHNQGFRDLAGSSHFLRDLLRVTYPLLADTKVLDPGDEINALSLPTVGRPRDVVVRPHARSIGDGRPTIVRSGSTVTLPERGSPKKIRTPQRPSSFVLIDADNSTDIHLSAHFSAVMAPIMENAVADPVSNSAVDKLLDIVVAALVEQVCFRKDFSGFGLFLKVPPGDQVHQAYFESYLLIRTMSALWSRLNTEQTLLQSPRTLTNLAKYCLHMAKAVFEGWFIDGAQPLVDFTGKVLDYVQQPEVASVKDVRLCSQAVGTIRTVFLRIVLLRLSELDEVKSDIASLKFFNQLTYWQTILFAPENQETPFIRLICYVLYTKLVSSSPAVRSAAASLFRMLLVLKPTEAATILVHGSDANQKHLSTGFMRLATHDDDELLQWIDERRAALDKFFLDSLSKYWEEFVDGENQKTEESGKNRIAKRREKLKKWQQEDISHSDFLYKAQQATNHWRVNSHAQDRMKLRRTLQDQQENISHVYTAIMRQHEVMRQPCGLQADQTSSKWQLDQTESRDRMRMRILRDRVQETEIYRPKRKMSERILAARGSAMVRSASGNSFGSTYSKPEFDSKDGNSVRSVSGETNPIVEQANASSSSLLEGDFELVEDPRDNQEAFEDKNRKIMRSVERGDSIKSVYNVSRIIGLEACEGLLIIGRKWLYLRDHMFQRSDGEIVGINNAPSEERDAYVQMISGRDIRSTRTMRTSATEDSAKSWSWKDVISMSKRRFLFRDVAIEVFFNDGRSYLLIFASPELRNSVHSDIISQAPHIIGPVSSMAEEDQWRLECLRSPEDIPQSLGNKFASVFNSTTANSATRKWMRGEISNFNYLMLVNTMAGRTFNDLTQYPVFPWVLSDYTSDELDLDDPRSYRILGKSMGCQNTSRESDFRERYQTFAEMGDEKPFHYGTHYSSAMIVTSYLIRLQPFVSSYLLLQGGSFDHADRLFDSLEKVWNSASKQNMTDVRELTPEFYYLPEFLTNVNGYDFGIKEGSGQAIGDVHLPKWAKGDPHLFIKRHREALESRYVSEHLHEWIDLIFGYKQKGEAAVEATNVFHPLSYQGAKDLDTIDDPVERIATIGIIHNFGQTPYQVFNRPHPRRENEKFAVQRLDSLADTLTRLPRPATEIGERVGSIMRLSASNRVLAAGACKLYAPPNGRFFAQWQYADNSLRFFETDSRRLLGLFEELHVGPISTVLFIDSKTLLTAGADCTIGVWELGSSSSEQLDLRPKTHLFGHRDTVTHLAVARAFSTLVSASADGQVLMWDLNRFDCIRILQPANSLPNPISSLKISNLTGHVLLSAGATAHLFTLNGHRLLSQRTGEDDSDTVTASAFYEGHAAEWTARLLLFTAHRRSAALKVWSLENLADGEWHLHLVKHLSHADPNREGMVDYRPPAITAVLPTDKAVFAGDESGVVVSFRFC